MNKKDTKIKLITCKGNRLNDDNKLFLSEGKEYQCVKNEELYPANSSIPYFGWIIDDNGNKDYLTKSYVENNFIIK